MTSTALSRSRTLGSLHIIEHHPHGDPDSAPTVLMLHGIGGSARSCTLLADHLAARGIGSWCLDAAGYGDSADPVGPHHDHVADVLTVADAVSPHRSVVLLGTSWGGVLAVSAALHRPDRVAALILADSTRGSGTTPAKAQGMRNRVRDLTARGPAVVADERAPHLLAPGADPVVSDMVRASMAAVRPAGFAAAARFMADTDHGPRLRAVACPTLVLVGASDTVTGVDESRLLAKYIPGALLRVIDEAGHVAIQEQPAIAAAHIDTFLEDLS